MAQVQAIVGNCHYIPQSKIIFLSFVSLILLFERTKKAEWFLIGKLMQLMHNSGSSRGMQSKVDTQGDLWRGWKCTQWHKSMLGRTGFRIHSPSRLQSPLAHASIEEQEGGAKEAHPVYVCMCVYWCISACQCIFAFMSRSVSGEYLVLKALCLQIFQAELLLIRSKHVTEDCTVLLCLYKVAMCSCVWNLHFIIKTKLS